MQSIEKKMKPYLKNIDRNIEKVITGNHTEEDKITLINDLNIISSAFKELYSTISKVITRQLNKN